MALLNEADTIYLGSSPVDAVYLGADKIWPNWTPEKLSGLVTWLDAEDYTPGSWSNRGSGPEVNIVGSPNMTVGAPRNGLPTVKFVVDQARVRSTWPYPVYDWTLIYVCHWVGPTIGRAWTVQYPTSNLLVGWHGAGHDLAYNNGVWIYGPGYYETWFPPYPWRMYSADQKATFTMRMWQDGVFSGEAGGAGGLLNGWGLSGYDAAGGQETCDMEVAELLLWNRRLTDPERVQAEDYLRTKWGLP